MDKGFYENLTPEFIDIDKISISKLLFEHTYALIYFYESESILAEMMTRVLMQVRRNLSPDIIIASFDVSKGETTHIEYGIKDLPAIVLFENGKQIGKLSGFRRAATIIDMINEHLIEKRLSI